MDENLGPNHESLGFDTPANILLSLLALEDGSVCFSLKQDPFDPKMFYGVAPWSPVEVSPEVRVFMERQRMSGMAQGYRAWISPRNPQRTCPPGRDGSRS